MSHPSTSSHRQQKTHQLELLRDITDDVEESDFVPYACFYDHSTIITKNGELCQTIKITGLNRETITSEHGQQELRSLIRESLKRHVPNDSFAFWLHTMRRESNVAPGGTFEEGSFAGAMHEDWVFLNRLEHQYVNEVYVTIVHEGQTASILDVKNFLRGLIPSVELRWRHHYLDEIAHILNDTVDRILTDLHAYGAHRLTAYKKGGVYYSEQLRFLEKLINFVDRPMPMVEMELSRYLTSGEITFGFNAMEVRNASGKRRFASILTLKEYKEASLPVIDRFLQLPMEFIVTQAVNFINPEKVLFEFQEMLNYQTLSEDPDISRLSELTDIVESNRNNPNDFGEQQLTIFILADNVTLLEENIRKSMAYFARYGMVAIREDIRFEEAYWSQLPGNFVFVKRMRPTNTSHVAGFANLNNMPVGRERGNHWGDAVTSFHTASGTPYYFNFHVGEVGHTYLTGPHASGKLLLAHFLIAQSMKYRPQLYYIDVSGRAGMLMEALGSHYITLQHPGMDEMAERTPLFNPFSLSNTAKNQTFLCRWLAVLARTMGYSLREQDKPLVQQMVAYIYGLDDVDRHMHTCYAVLYEQIPEMAQALAPWIEGEAYGHLFTATGAGVFADTHCLHIYVGQALADDHLMAGCASLMMQLITDRLDGAPAIIMMEEGYELLRHTHIAGNMEKWLDALTGRNAILVHTIEDMDRAAQMPFMKALADGAATQIFMPDDEPGHAYMDIFNMQRSEFTYLEFMETNDHHFLVKHGGETVVGEMHMESLSAYYHILAGYS
ncbi:MAG: hypothetical protein F6K62_10550 [Sphaerospermopsis sp. SIO1G2]|nr:hypothetical protein [Sphaerospermopsis sp. SIO1G2]